MNYSESPNKKSITLNVSNYSTGMYFVRITSEKGTRVQKFVKK